MAVTGFATVDIVIGVVILISAAFGLVRGLIHEVVSLGIWVAALLLATTLATGVSELMGLDLAPRLRIAIGFLVVFIAVLVLGAVLQWTLGTLVRTTGLTGTDRTLGLVFGAARGVVVVLVALIALRPFVEERAWWAESKLTAPLLAFEDDFMAVADYFLETLIGISGEAPEPPGGNL